MRLGHSENFPFHKESSGCLTVFTKFQMNSISHPSLPSSFHHLLAPCSTWSFPPHGHQAWLWSVDQGEPSFLNWPATPPPGGVLPRPVAEKPQCGHLSTEPSNLHGLEALQEPTLLCVEQIPIMPFTGRKKKQHGVFFFMIRKCN